MEEINFEENYLALNGSEISNLFFNFELDNIEIDFSVRDKIKNILEQYKLILQNFKKLELKEKEDFLVERQIIESADLKQINGSYILELRLINNIMKIEFENADLLLF